MIKVRKEGKILEKTKHPFENQGELNSEEIKEVENVHQYYSAGGQGKHSTVCNCYVNGSTGVSEQWEQLIMAPEIEFKSLGTEYPRIINIEEYRYLSYTGNDEINSRSALLLSNNLGWCRRTSKWIGKLSLRRRLTGLSIPLQRNQPLTSHYFQAQTSLGKTKKSKQYNIPARDHTLIGGTMYNYYGAANEQIAIDSVNFTELFSELISRW
jgi:hypothetical protein